MWCENTIEARETKTDSFLGEHDAVFIHPYDADDIIAGQGTVALEFEDQVRHLDQLWVPVGGGGLIAGSILATEDNPRVFGVEPELAGETKDSLEKGIRQPAMTPLSIADGLLASIGARNFEILKRFNTKVHLVSENEIRSAMRLLWNTLKIVVEPSAAVAFAGILGAKDFVLGKRVGVILTGGNVDLQLRPPESG